MNIKLISLTYLITLVTCGTSGKAKISTHYYDVDLPRLDTNRVFCGYKGSHMDINRITAVQSLTLNECGACLKVTAKNGKFVYVMAVDKGGFGLDLNKKSFIQLFGINTGRFDAKWEKVEASHCKGILKGENYKTPGLNESGKGKGKKKKLDINETENQDNTQTSDAFTSKQDIDYLYNSEHFDESNNSNFQASLSNKRPRVITDDDSKKFSKQYNKNKGKMTETRKDIKDLEFNVIDYKNNKQLDATSDKKKTQHSSYKDNDGLLYDNDRDDLEAISKSQTDNDNDNNEDNVNYRKMEPLATTNDKSGNARDDIGDIADIDFREVKNRPSKKVSNDVVNITKHTFRRMRPNSVKEKAKKDDKGNVERKYHDYESNGREDLKHINHINYRKKSDKDKSKKDNDKDQKKEKPKKDNKKDKKKEKPQKKDNITKDNGDNKKEPEEIKDSQENQIFELSEYTRGDAMEVYFGDD